MQLPEEFRDPLIALLEMFRRCQVQARVLQHKLDMLAQAGVSIPEDSDASVREKHAEVKETAQLALQKLQEALTKNGDVLAWLNAYRERLDTDGLSCRE